MYVEIKLILDVEEQDSIQDAIEAAQNQICSMDSRDLDNMMEYTVLEN